MTREPKSPCRSLVCSIDYHDRCDGGCPNGPARTTGCTCWCHEVRRRLDAIHAANLADGGAA